MTNASFSYLIHLGRNVIIIIIVLLPGKWEPAVFYSLNVNIVIII